MEATEPSSGASELVEIAGVKLELWSAGQGRPVLFLHPGDGFQASALPLALAAHHRVIAPSHPGFGRSELPADFRTVDDLAYYYLDFLKARQLQDVVLVGVSFGGWIAAEMAIKSTQRLAGLVLIGTLGARFTSDPKTREIADLFSVPQYEQARLLYHDEQLQRRSFGDLPDDELLRLARNHESFCLYGWSPTLHDPKLARRLHRIDVPTQVLWGSQDRVVAPSYGRSFAAAIPGASFSLIEGCGHYAHIERPEPIRDAVEAFIGSLPAARESGSEGRA